jgi:hypothetical protein
LITQKALKSLLKFIQFRILSPFHPDIYSAICDLVNALVRCKFEATDVTTDEVVLLTLIEAMVSLVRSDLGKFVSDGGLSNIHKVILGILVQPRISEQVRYIAENSTMELVRFVSSRVEFWISGRGKKLNTLSNMNLEMNSEVEMTLATDNLSHSPTKQMVSASNSPTKGIASNSNTFTGFIPYLDILNSCCNLMDPTELRHTNVHKMIGLKIICEMMEVYRALDFESVRTIENSMTLHSTLQSMVPTTMNQDSGVKEGQKAEMTVSASTDGVVGISSSQWTTRDVDVNEMAKECDSAPATPEIHATSNAPATSSSSPPPNELSNSATTFSQFYVQVRKLLMTEVSKQVLHLFVSPSTNPKLLELICKTSHTLFSICEAKNAKEDFLIAHKEFLVKWICEKLQTGIQAWDLEQWCDDGTGIVEDVNQNVARADTQDSDTPRDSQTRQGRDSMSRVARDSTTSKRVDPLDPTVRYMYLQTLYHLLTPQTLSLLYTRNDGQEWERNYVIQDVFHTLVDSCIGDKKGYLSSSVMALATETIVRILKEWSQRSNVGNFDVWIEKQSKKDIILKGANLFSENVKEGIKYFQDVGLLPTPLTDDAMAEFLFKSELDKARVGDYLAKPKHLAVLQKFTSFFEFTGLRIDEALRFYLDKFRLPGESQQIERILDTFAKRYFDSHEREVNHEIANLDACSILAFSIIMLNTDLHNPQVRVLLIYVEKNVLD